LNEEVKNEEIREFRFLVAKMYELPKVDELVLFLKDNLKDGVEIVGFGSIFKQYYVKIKVKNNGSTATASREDDKK
jgi:hypothetical protein